MELRMATIKDVARMAGVSTSTVSRTLSGKIRVDEQTREKVLRCVSKLKYQPNALAQGLKDGRTRTIAFFIPNIENLIYPSLAIAVETAARQRGYFVMFCNTQDDRARERDYVEKLKNRFVDGFLFSTAMVGEAHPLIRELRDQDYPTVCLMRSTEDETDSFISANEEGAWMATRYLVDQGFSRIATITGRPQVLLYTHRMRGYERAMRESGLPVDKALIWHGIADNKELAYACALEQVKAGNVPEAVFAQSDPLALHAMQAFLACGLRIPEDISVIGYDNAPHGEQFNPALTTIDQPLHEMGRAAAMRLIDIIEGLVPAGSPARIFPPRLILRDSVKRKTDCGGHRA